MNKSNDNRKQKQCTVRLKAEKDTYTGKLIEFLNDGSDSKTRLIQNTLEARFLPFVLDKDDPNFHVHVYDCLGQLEGFKQAIINYYGITTYPQGQGTVVPAKRVEVAQRQKTDVTDDVKENRQKHLNRFKKSGV